MVKCHGSYFVMTRVIYAFTSNNNHIPLFISFKSTFTQMQVNFVKAVLMSHWNTRVNILNKHYYNFHANLWAQAVCNTIWKPFINTILFKFLSSFTVHSNNNIMFGYAYCHGTYWRKTFNLLCLFVGKTSEESTVVQGGIQKVSLT